MNLQDIITALQEAIKRAPKLIEDFREIFAKDAPTEADWAALKAKINSKVYEDYVPATRLRPLDPIP